MLTNILLKLFLKRNLKVIERLLMRFDNISPVIDKISINTNLKKYYFCYEKYKYHTSNL